MSDAEAKRQRNRELMPNVAALVDEWKEQFPDLKVIWAKDLVTGHEVGKKEEPDPSKVFVIPPNYFPTSSRETPKKGRKR
jgi:hypothetical protein